MARYSVDFTTSINRVFNHLTLSQCEDEILRIRDLFRAELTGSDFVVSDVVKWPGGTTDYYGYAFVIKNGAREWCYLFGGRLGSSSSPLRYWFCWNSSSASAYVKKLLNGYGYQGSSSPSYSAGMSTFMLYNGGIDSYGFGFDDVNALTFTGGDFSAPAQNPTSGQTEFLATFPQADTTSALAVTDFNENSFSFLSREYEFNYYLFILDDINPSITCYYQNSGNNGKASIRVYGNIVSNYDVLDTDGEAVFSMYFNEDNIYPGTISNFYMQARNISGVSEDFSYSRHNDFSVLNRLDSNGDFKFNSIQVSNTGYTKGIFKTDLIAVMGSWDSFIDFRRIVDGPNGPYLRYERGMGTPYKAGIERWPWPSENVPGA